MQVNRRNGSKGENTKCAQEGKAESQVETAGDVTVMMGGKDEEQR